MKLKIHSKDLCLLFIQIDNTHYFRLNFYSVISKATHSVRDLNQGKKPIMYITSVS